LSIFYKKNSVQTSERTYLFPITKELLSFREIILVVIYFEKYAKHATRHLDEYLEIYFLTRKRGWKSMARIRLAQVMDQRRDLMEAATNLLFT
jgi:hypothetical protein